MSAPPPVASGRSIGAQRRSFGVLSIVLAAVSFGVRTAMLGVHTHLPTDISGTARDVATWAFILALLVLAPIVEASGVVLGIAALFRPRDRKGLGILGALLNVMFLAGGVMFAIILIAYIGRAS